MNKNKFIPTFESFADIVITNENEQNSFLTDDYALVATGGSIGSKHAMPVFTKVGLGNITETGNDLVALKEKAARYRKQLSAGEKTYYKMGYTVIKLTPAKRKEIQALINSWNASVDTEEA